MEKGNAHRDLKARELILHQSRYNRRKLQATIKHCGILVLLLGVLWYWAAHGPSRSFFNCKEILQKHYSTSASLRYQNKIAWTSCGDNLECGRLEVPLDYANASLGTASLAVVRYPATDRKARLGALFTNPGGPGGSGVQFVTLVGKIISEYFDGKYDIVSWDPRGVEGTTPRVECFTSQTAQAIFQANTHEEILPEGRNLSDPTDLGILTSQLRLADARNAAVAQLCREKSGEALKHVGTATVVRDLERLYSTLEGDETPINFWGFSYGTVVGSYLVNMFPDRVGKIAIDGVVDPVLWSSIHSEQLLQYELVDIEQVLHNFYVSCAEAGPSRCALATNTSTAKSISAQVDKVIDDLYAHALPVPHANRPGALTSSMVRVIIFINMYAPREWARLASLLSSVIQGDGLAMMNEALRSIELNSTVPAQTAYSTQAVWCVDEPGYDGISKEAAFQAMLDAIIYQSKTVSPHFGSLSVGGCWNWPTRETERFTGPFNNTLKNEILVIGNTADPVTPLQNAKAVNRLLSNSSRLIIQDSSGHSSLALVSLCTIKAVKAYFLEGALPPNGLVCAADEQLFPPAPSDKTDSMYWLNTAMGTLSEEDARLLQTARDLGKGISPHFSPLRRRVF